MPDSTPTMTWQTTTAADLRARLARGEWPLIRVISDQVGPGQCTQARLRSIRSAGGLHYPDNMLAELVVAATGEISKDVHLTNRELWVWIPAVPTTEEAPSDWASAYYHDLRLTLGLPQTPEPTWPAMIGMVNKLVSASAKPSHRGYTLTTETIALARTVCRDAREIYLGCEVSGDVPEFAALNGLLAALQHAEGIPAEDLRTLAAWVADAIGQGNEVNPDDAEVKEIADHVLTSLAVDAMPAGSVQVIGSTDAAEPDYAKLYRTTAFQLDELMGILETDGRTGDEGAYDYLRRVLAERKTLRLLATAIPGR